MFENPRRGRQARNFTKKCSENSRSQIVFRTDIFRKLTLGAPDIERGKASLPVRGPKTPLLKLPNFLARKPIVIFL